MVQQQEQPLPYVATGGKCEDTNVMRFMRKHDIDRVEDLLVRSIDEPEWFWPAVEHEVGITWHRAPTNYAAPADFGGVWFRGGVGNAVDSVLVQHLAARRDKTALRWVGEPGEVVELSYAQLASRVEVLAQTLRGVGIGVGDRVGIFLPNLPEAYVAMLACSHIGAVFCPVFSGYGEASVLQRFSHFLPQVIVTCDGFWRGGKVRRLKRTIDAVRGRLPESTRVIMLKRAGIDVGWDSERDIPYPEDPLEPPSLSATASLAAEHPLAVLYTSGSTGQPKGTVHTHGSFVLKCVNDYFFCFDVKPTDRVLWLGDPGWAAGSHLLYAALTIGATAIVYEGSPDYPRPGRLWQEVAASGTTILGLSPTVLRQARQHGLRPAEENDLSRLRLLGSAGEAWDEDTWKWFFIEVGKRRCPIINWSGGTEVAGGILGCYPHLPLVPAAFHGAVPGMAPDVVDATGKPIVGTVGELVITRPAMGMTRSFWKNDEGFRSAYLTARPGVWTHGDLALKGETGSWFVVGRSDDTLKVAGRRVGPAEVESVVNDHPRVVESAVVSIPGGEKGHLLCIFVVANPGEDSLDLAGEVTQRVITQMGTPFAPDRVVVVPGLPKSRSFKILRRVIREVATGATDPDLSAVENTESLQSIPRIIASVPLNPSADIDPKDGNATTACI